MILDTTTKSLELVLGSATTTGNMPVVVDYVDNTSTAFAPGSVDTQSNGTTPVVILAAPGSGVQRKVNALTLFNADTAAKVATIRLNNNATLRTIYSVTLQVGDTLGYTDITGWYVQDSSGSRKGTGPTGSTGAPGLTGAFIVGADGLDGDEGAAIPGPIGPVGPAGGSTTTTKLPQISVTPGSGALTIAGVAKYLDFRSATLTSGTPSTVNADPADLVIPSGATLGSVTTVSARIIVVEMNNAGISEYAVANISGGLQMDEMNLISTTAIDTASDSANVWYSTTARSNLPYRVVACFDAVNTAGVWGNPTLVQPAGGNALTAMSSLGYGQTWQNYTGAGRVIGTTYYSGNKSRMVNVSTSVGAAANDYWILTIGGFSLGRVGQAYSTNALQQVFFIVPPFTSYILSFGGGSAAATNWSEAN